MKKIYNTFLNFIKYKYLEILSFITLLLWTISPLIEYYLKYYNKKYYTYYFNYIIYLIGIIGFITYIIYFLKLKKEKKLHIKMFIPEIILLVLIILSIISSILSTNTHLSIFGENYRKEGLIVYIMYIGIILLSSIIHDTKYIKYICKSIIISAFIITVLPFFEINYSAYHFSNIFQQFNHYGYYLMINTMLSAFIFIESDKLYKKIFYCIIYIFFIYLLIRNDTFGSYLAISISLFFLFIYSLIKKYKRKSIILISIIFILTSFLVSKFDIKLGEINNKNTSNLVSNNFSTFTKDIKGITKKDEKISKSAGTGRGLLWKEAWNYTKEHPIFGGGMESLKDYYITKKVYYNDRPHNIFLQISSFIGIPGAIIYFILIIYIAIASLKHIKHNICYVMIYFTSMCYFISSFFGNSMYYTSPYFMILLGLLIGLIRTKQKQTK